MRLDSPPEDFKLLKVDPLLFPSVRPDPFAPTGMSSERQQELYTSVRPYVQEQFRDITCTYPSAN